MLARIEAGLRSAAGASATTSPAAIASTAAVNLAAARVPSRVATMTAMMASAGQAVYFIAHATARIRAAATVSRRCLRSCRTWPPAVRAPLASSASDRQIRAITGGSVFPMASARAMIGDASQNAAVSSAPGAVRAARSLRAARPVRASPGASVTRNVA